MKYKIMGNIVEINISDDELNRIAQKELEIYQSMENERPDIKVSVVDKIITDSKYSNNPKIHKTFKNAFLVNLGYSKILYKLGDKLEIFVEIDKRKNYLNKFISMGYRYNYENIGQILHELVFVPANFFQDSKSIVHASAMKNKDKNKTIMIGGTGGVGKTSLELMLCRDLEFSFIADDIAIVDNKGYVYPNLSFPKIYAYNVHNNSNLKKTIFSNRSFLDKFQWAFIKKFRGTNRVRRAVSPYLLFKNVETEVNKIDKYYILFMTNGVNDITIDTIDSILASELSFKIIRNEYSALFQHFIWHEYNCKLQGYKPLITMDEITTKWTTLYNQIFSKIQCHVVKIPGAISHEEFLDRMKIILNNN